MIEQRVIQEVVSALNLRGDREREMALCPFHDDTTPSLAVYFTPGNEHVHCFGCGVHFSFVKFLMEFYNCSYSELAEKLGLDVDKRRVIFNRFAFLCSSLLFSDGVAILDGEEIPALELLTDKRGHSEEVLRRMKIGCISSEWSMSHVEDELKKDFKMSELKSSGLFKAGKLIFPAGSIIFPVKRNGEIVGFRAKIYGKNKTIVSLPKSKFLKWTPLWNVDALWGSGRVFLVEGEDDAMKLMRFGQNAVAFCGAGVSEEKVKVVKESFATDIVIAFDRDEEGVNSATKLFRILSQAGKKVTVYTPIHGKDVDEELSHGITDCLSAEPKESFYIEEREDGCYITTEKGQRKISNFLLDVEGKNSENGETQLLLKLTVPQPVATDGSVHVTIPSSLLSDSKVEILKRLSKTEILTWDAPASALRDFILFKARLKRPLPDFYIVNERGLVTMGERRCYIAKNAIILPNNYSSYVNGTFFEVGHSKVFLKHERGAGEILLDLDLKVDTKQIERLIDSFSPAQKAVFAWFIGTLWSDEIYKALGFYPLLWIWGEQGAGKTTFTSLLQAMFTRIRHLKASTPLFIRIVDSTPEGCARRLSTLSSVPVIIDDFRKGLRSSGALLSLARAVYDRSSSVKGMITPNKDSEHVAVKERETKACLCFTSQTLPTDAALKERCLVIEFSRNELDPAQEKLFRESLDALHAFGISLIHKALNEKIIDARFLSNVSKTTSRPEKALHVLSLILRSIGLDEADAVAAARQEAEQMETDWDTFLEHFETLVQGEYLERGIHFDVAGDEVWVAVGAVCAEIEKHLGRGTLPVSPKTFARYAKIEGSKAKRVYNKRGTRVRVHFFPKETRTGRFVSGICGALDSYAEDEEEDFDAVDDL